jgi:hypothetical protein
MPRHPRQGGSMVVALRRSRERQRKMQLTKSMPNIVVDEQYEHGQENGKNWKLKRLKIKNC